MFIYNLESIAKKLKIDFDGITSKFNHKVVKGSVREDLLKEYLRKLLPSKYSISNGIIIDSRQTQSKQQDFIIHDSFNCPRVYDSSSNTILPVESVYATIEVKSVLNYKNLKECVENIKSVRNLKKLSKRTYFTNEFSDQYPLGFVFAYSSDCSLERIQTKLFEYNKEIDARYQISIVCILDKGLILNVSKNNMSNILLAPTNDSLLARSEGDITHTLYSFYLFLLEYLNNVFIQVPSLIDYAYANNSFNISTSIPNELIPNDALLPSGDSYGKLRELQELVKNDFAFSNSKPTLFDFRNCFISTIPGYVEKIQKIKLLAQCQVNLWGKTFNNESLDQLKKHIEEYSTNDKSSDFINKITEEMYSQYKNETENPTK